MRFLHTGDWHLDKQIGGRSRQPEFEAVLQEVTGIARDEGVDAVLIAGDVYETFSPPPEAEKLFYETIAELLSGGTKVVVIAGNHDHAHRMDALTNILRMAGAYCVGSLPDQAADAILTLPSRDGSESATVAALPWLPERYALRFETLMAEPGEALKEYAGAVEGVIRRLSQRFTSDGVNIFLAHLLLDGAEIGPDGGERKLHIGHNFAVSAQALPATAHYVALGHVHRSQRISAPAPAYYAGSLLQLDFGEEGQPKSVRIIDAHRGSPAQVREVPINGGKRLRAVRVKYADLAAQRGAYGDDYLKVLVELDRPTAGLFEQVRDVLPNVLAVTPVYREGASDPAPEATRQGLAPHELFGRYYQQEYGAETPAALLQLFNNLHESVSHASS